MAAFLTAFPEYLSHEPVFVCLLYCFGLFENSAVTAVPSIIGRKSHKIVMLENVLVSSYNVKLIE